MATRVLKPVALDETVQEVVEKLNGIKDVLDTKTFTPSVLLDNKSITENGVYEAVLDDDTPCDGYAKVTVNVAGGSIDFESVMLQNVAPATVPTSWEIPVTATSIPNRYEGRDALLDNKATLKSVTLAADGHPGLTSIGDHAFSEFENIDDISFADGADLLGDAFSGCKQIINIPNSGTICGANVFAGDTLLSSVNMSDFSIHDGDGGGTFSDCSNLETATNIPLDMSSGKNGRLPDWMFNGTKVKEPTFQHTVKFLGSGCFANLQIDGVFSSSQITNENYYINEDVVPMPPYRWYNQDAQVEVYTVEPPVSDEDLLGYATKPTLVNEDGSPYDERSDAFHTIQFIHHTGRTWWIVVYDTEDGPDQGTEYDGERPGTKNDEESGQFSENTASGYNLPALVKIGKEMFTNNKNVTEFSFPNVTRISERAFSGCENTTTFNLPKCEYLYMDAFDGCNNMQLLKLTQVTSVTHIENTWGFPQLDNPVTVQVPNALLSDFQSDSEWSQLVNDNKIVLQGV